MPTTLSTLLNSRDENVFGAIFLCLLGYVFLLMLLLMMMLSLFITSISSILGNMGQLVHLLSKKLTEPSSLHYTLRVLNNFFLKTF